MEDINKLKFKLDCELKKEDVDIIFQSIDFYKDCSILFTKDRKIANKCNEIWLLLNDKCVENNNE